MFGCMCELHSQIIVCVSCLDGASRRNTACKSSLLDARKFKKDRALISKPPNPNPTQNITEWMALTLLQEELHSEWLQVM